MLDCIYICVFPFLKNYFKATSIDPWHLSRPGLSVELFNCFLLQSQHLLIARWIDRESSCPLDTSLIHRACFAEDTSGHLLIAASVETFKARPLSRHLYLSRITEHLYICSARSGLHFLDLSCLFTFQTFLSHSKLHLKESFGLNQVLLHLVSL